MRDNVTNSVKKYNVLLAVKNWQQNLNAIQSNKRALRIRTRILYCVLASIKSYVASLLCLYNLGERPRYVLTSSNIRSPGNLLHVRAESNDQETDSEMDHGCLHFLLLDLHCRSVLSSILHFDPWRCHSGPGRRSHVECQVHLPFSGLQSHNPFNFR